MGKTRKAAAPKTTEQLILQALKLAATNSKAKWTGNKAPVLFNTKEANHEAAIAECTKENSAFLVQVDTGGKLTATGFERLASELPAEETRTIYDQLREETPEDQVGALARVMAVRIPVGERVAFIQGVIRRTPVAATELTLALEEAVAAEKIELEARVAAAEKRRAEEEAVLKALERIKELTEEQRQNRRAALRREYEVEGGNANDLRDDKPTVGGKPERRIGAEPTTAEEKDFRRDVAKQLAEMWRAAWKDKKAEASEYLESAMWNVSGLEMIGEPKARLPFDGRYHECATAAFTGDHVLIVRPGWLVREGSSDYVAIKAAVEKV